MYLAKVFDSLILAGKSLFFDSVLYSYLDQPTKSTVDITKFAISLAS